MIKTIIFDIGNVLADFAWEPFFRSFGFSEEVFERVANATVRSAQWIELDRGGWTTEQVIDAFVANDPGVEQELREVFRDPRNLVVKRDYAIPWIRQLKADGYQVLYLSNLGEMTERHCCEALTFIPYTDGGILSYKVQLIKPDLAIYRALIKKYDLKPEECIFIDDTLVNVEAAAQLGFHVIHAVNHEAVLEALALIGIKSYKD